MKKIIRLLVFLIILISIPYKAFSCINDEEYINKVKRDLLVLMIAYKGEIIDVEKDENNLIYIVMKDNRKILYDDKKEKSYGEKFSNADLEDTLDEKYPLEMINCVMDDNVDPGRIRNYKLLGAMYGDNKEQIEKNIKLTSTYYGNVMFNSVNNADEALKNALKDISDIVSEKQQISSFISPLSGGYNYRQIQDTGLLSPHAYGISIDLNRNDSDYWKWVSKEKGSARIASYPEEIVRIFESNGFVWGGKWAHFDILHFEYRPEIILKAKYFNNYDEKEFKEWYGNITIDEEIEDIIKRIDEKV